MQNAATVLTVNRCGVVITLNLQLITGERGAGETRTPRSGSDRGRRTCTQAPRRRSTSLRGCNLPGRPDPR